MTQKELLYFEDAIHHEESIISICQNAKDSLQNEELITFLDSEIQIHTGLKENLLNLLEGKVHE